MKAHTIILLIVLVALTGGLAFLSTWNIPPPAEQVERVIPNEKLLQ